MTLKFLILPLASIHSMIYKVPALCHTHTHTPVVLLLGVAGSSRGELGWPLWAAGKHGWVVSGPDACCGVGGRFQELLVRWGDWTHSEEMDQGLWSAEWLWPITSPPLVVKGKANTTSHTGLRGRKLRYLLRNCFINQKSLLYSAKHTWGIIIIWHAHQK